jgi:uncharacterized protein YjbI with pentapeptide repeats
MCRLHLKEIFRIYNNAVTQENLNRQGGFMSKNFVFIKGDDFVRKLLAGERDFSRIKLEERFDLCGHDSFDALQKHLKSCDLKANPVNLDGAHLRGLDADGIHLPFLCAKGACFKHASLMGVNFECAQLEGADLRYARLSGSILSSGDLTSADLRSADLNLAVLIKCILKEADFSFAELADVNMKGADLKGARSLERARSLKTVNFQFAQIGPKERGIIRQALWAEDGKKQRLFGGAG